ncbi:group II intron maturase-specific domain-containing protein [Nonomuraea sp. NPDC000554]|uniref:group II intron maturase-specific domain-containing protein n=1 Tax=Nonomuraea sp. NPDC000554 TaxID=3154259 RepID=UPI003323E113
MKVWRSAASRSAASSIAKWPRRRTRYNGPFVRLPAHDKVRTLRSSNAMAVIARLNSITRGWSAYYRGAHSCVRRAEC